MPFLNFSVRVEVYQKNGLKRGPGLTDASFAPFAWSRPEERQIAVTGGGPLGGSVYQLRMQRWVSQVWPNTTYTFHLKVMATRHYGQNFYVRDGDNFEVRLDRV